MRSAATRRGHTPVDPTRATRSILLSFVLPMWLAAGVAEWFYRRRTRTQAVAGSKESVLHLLMLGEAALPVLAGLFLEITSPVLLLMFGAVVARGATALWDSNDVGKRREVTPVEQHVRGYLEMVPVMAVAVVSILHWPEVKALFRYGQSRPDWTIRRSRAALPTRTIAGVVTALTVLEAAPYLEQLWRSRRWWR